MTIYPPNIYMGHLPGEGGYAYLVNDPEGMVGYRAKDNSMVFGCMSFPNSLESLEGRALFLICQPSDLIIGERVIVASARSDFYGRKGVVYGVGSSVGLAQVEIEGYDDPPLTLFAWRLRPIDRPWPEAMLQRGPARPQQLSLF